MLTALIAVVVLLATRRGEAPYLIVADDAEPGRP